jgi:hypothetical protein
MVKRIPILSKIIPAKIKKSFLFKRNSIGDRLYIGHFDLSFYFYVLLYGVA